MIYTNGIMPNIPFASVSVNQRVVSAGAHGEDGHIACVDCLCWLAITVSSSPSEPKRATFRKT